MQRVAVLEAENRAKAETLVDFQVTLSRTEWAERIVLRELFCQGEFTTAQEKLLAALAQNQKYEEVVSQRLDWLGF